ncbi:MAG TPA: MSMEG_6728 family protein [Geminicoccaceae bacterium]|nr:MSMEG_6728 family protein [Geminicoccaceae bacterium]
MQTFLPYPDVAASVACLDHRRLGKQRVEALQVLNALAALREGRPYGWQRHPAVRMWRGHDDLLAAYMNAAVDEWERRGFRNAMARRPVPAEASRPRSPPWWWGDERLHASHRSNLLRKDPAHYGRFGWPEPPDLPYFWPV